MSQVWNASIQEEPAEPHIVRRIGMTASDPGDGTLDGTMVLTPALRAAGGIPLLGPVGSFTDTIGGVMAALRIYPTALATADLGLVLDPRARPERLRTSPVVLRAGRTSVVTEMQLRDEHDEIVGYCTMTSAVLGNAQPQQFDPRIVTTYMVHESSPLDEVPLYDQIGLVAGPGLGRAGGPGARIEVAPHLGNSLGMIHGGVTVMLTDAAATAAAEAVLGRPAVTVDAHVRYLNGARVGPVVASTTVVAADAGSVTVRVEQWDVGGDRRTSVATARAVAAGD